MSASLQHVLEVDSTVNESNTDYRLDLPTGAAVSEPGETGAESTTIYRDKGDSIKIDGTVDNGVHTFRFNCPEGEEESVTVLVRGDDPAPEVRVDDTVIAEAEMPDTQVSIESATADEVGYHLWTTGPIEEPESSAEDTEAIRTNGVEGRVDETDTDSYTVDGRILNVRATSGDVADLSITVNGEEFDPTSLPAFDHEIVFSVEPGVTEDVNYSVAVGEDGEIHYSLDPMAHGTDGSGTEGTVGEGNRDAYFFHGPITEFGSERIEDLSVMLDGKPCDPVAIAESGWSPGDPVPEPDDSSDNDESDGNDSEDGDSGGSDGNPEEPGSGDATPGVRAYNFGPNDAQRVDLTFETVVDASDIGATPEGGSIADPIESFVEDSDSDSILVRFDQAGTYSVDETISITGDRDVGFVVHPDVDNDVRVRPANGFKAGSRPYGSQLFEFENRHALIDGFDLDYRGEDVSPSITFETRHTSVANDIEQLGRALPADGRPARYGFYTAVEDPNATMIYRNVRMPHADRIENYTDGGDTGRWGYYANPNNKATIELIDCVVRETSGHGIYAAASQNDVNVRGGNWGNTYGVNIRVPASSTVENVIVEKDAEEYDGPGGTGCSGHLVFFETKKRKSDQAPENGGLIRGCNIRTGTWEGNLRGGIVVAKSHGHLRVEDTNVQIDTDDTPGLHAFEPDGGPWIIDDSPREGHGSYHLPPEPRTIEIRNSTFSGKGDGEPDIDIDKRPGSTVKNVSTERGIVGTVEDITGDGEDPDTGEPGTGLPDGPDPNGWGRNPEPQDLREHPDGETIDHEGYDHILVADGKVRGSDSNEYVFVVAGEVEAVMEPSAWEGDHVHPTGNFAIVTGTVDNGRDAYRFNGTVVHAAVEHHLEHHYADPDDVLEGRHTWRDAPFEFRVDGVPRNPLELEPKVPFGHTKASEMPDHLTITESECDHVATNYEELEHIVDERLSPGERFGIKGDGFELPGGEGVKLEIPDDRVALVWLPGNDGTYPELYRDGLGEDDSWGNCQIQLQGDYVSVWNPVMRGPFDSPHGYGDGGRIRGLEFTGLHPISVNSHTWYWSHAGISHRGTGGVSLGGDSHHNQQAGLGYGGSASGQIDDDDIGYKKEDVLDAVGDWHERTTFKMLDLDANRHSIASGSHGSYELAYSRSGKQARFGSHVLDAHRPGGDIVIVHDCVVRKPELGMTDGDENVPGFVMRGWAQTACVLSNVWFTWGPEPDPENRNEFVGTDKGATIQQKYASSWDNWQEGDVDESSDMRLVRGQHSFDEKPFRRLYWTNCAFGPERPGWVKRYLVPGKVEYPGLISVQALGSSAAYTIEVAAGGEIVPGSKFGVGDDDPADVIGENGRSAEGAVGGSGEDTLRFTGNVTDFRLDGPANVVVTLPSGWTFDPGPMSVGASIDLRQS